MKKIAFFFYILFCFTANAQLVVDNTTQTPKQLVQNVVIGQGVSVSNIKYNGTVANANVVSDQVGFFSNGLTTNIGVNSGIILSTGNAIIAKGPNDTALGTLPASNPFTGDNDLYILSNNQSIQNVAILEFDFIPTGNKLSFNFVFASDEYPEFVNDTYNDTFGFFLSGPGIAGPFTGGAKNIALIPTTTLPVSINNLNNGNFNAGPCENCQYYVNNEGGTSIQYDGFTTVLAANSDVICGQTYHIKLAIANVGDNNYDSAVFIEGASFSSPAINLGPDLQICSATNTILNSGLNTSEIHEWRYNGTVIPGQIGSQINVNQSGLYEVQAFPFGATCPVNDAVNISFSTPNAPIISCGIKTASSVTFDWNTVPNATSYSVSYQIGSNIPVVIGNIGNVSTYTVNGLNSGDAVLITITPIGVPMECFTAASQSYSLSPCVVPTIAITQGSPNETVCIFNSLSAVVYTFGGGATSATISSGVLPNGITANVIGNQLKIEGTPTASGTYNYTISTLGGCLPNAAINGSITVYASNSPVFNAISPICTGDLLAALPLQSNNGIDGTWTPALNNTITTEYTFTPNTGQCASSAKLTITVNPKTTPSFTAVTAICAGELINPLPLQSNNGITGTWTPALNNTTTTEYTFTPNAGQCASSAKLTITVNPKLTPTFTAVAAICAGESINPLPLQSNNGITGTWTPALNNTLTTEYTFTPNAGQCANSTKLTITVNPKATPTFTAVAPICAGELIPPLPLQSNNGITGTWTPALNNTITTEYTFTPNAGQCANSTKLTITVNPKVTPTFTTVAPICAGELIAPLPLQSNNGITGTWTPALNSATTTEYTFTPNAGQCAVSTRLQIVVLPKPNPILKDGSICIDKKSNTVLQSYLLDSNLNSNTHTFEWFLNGIKLENAIESTLEALQKGTYAVRTTAINTNCISNLVEASVTEIESNTATFKITQSNAFSGDANVTVTVLEGTGRYQYQLDQGVFQLSNVFTEVASGIHFLRIIDAVGCTDLNFKISVIGYPKFFTPNGDGQNETWNVIGLSSQYNPVVTIFDRYGKLLKQMKSTDFGWDGTYNGIPMPATDYWFKVIYLEEGIDKEFKSHFSLKR